MKKLLYLIALLPGISFASGNILISGTASGGGSGTITGVTAGTGLSGGGTSGTVTLNIANTSVSPATYGSAAQVSSITVGADGRLTGAANIPISISTSNLNATGANGTNFLMSNNTWATPAGGGGGGSSPLEVFNNFNSARSSPTASIGMSAAFAGSVTGSTFTFSMNTSSVTLYGPNIPAASISAGSLGSSVIASSITLAAMYGSPTLTGTNFTSLPGAQVGSGVPAANIAAGSLGLSVIASSHAVSSVLDAAIVGLSSSKLSGALPATVLVSSFPITGVTAGSYGSATTSPNYTVDAYGRLTAAASTTITPAASNITAGALPNTVLASSFPVTGVTAGSYTLASITVDAQGRLSAASNGSASGSVAGSTGTVGITLDGGGSAIVAGSTRSVTVPYACTVSSWTLIADVSGSLSVHISTSTYGNYPTLSNISGAGTSPSLSSAQKNASAPVGWSTTTLSAGTIVSFVVDSAATATWANLVLWLIKS